MGSQAINAADLDSPGYEYLRTYRAMADLYFKLVALDYQKEFCPLYKCPPIHKFYFALASANQVEQQFAFMCLCVWLIKDKCQMNFDADPRDYQDLDATVGVIYEALKLLLSPDESQPDAASKNSLFPIGRLKQGYGPEVIYCLNRLADRALELALEDDPKLGSQPAEIVYCNKQRRGAGGGGAASGGGAANSIIIGEPFVGGGLTTRPLGNYQIDDSSLIFDYEHSGALANGGEPEPPVACAAWTQDKLDKIAPLLEVQYEAGADAEADEDERGELGGAPAASSGWLEMLDSVRRARAEVGAFSREARPALEMLRARVERQLQTMGGREAAANASLRAPLEGFLEVWREHCELSRRNAELGERIGNKTDTFERYVEQLKELRTKEVKLNDESELAQLEQLTQRLTQQTRAMDLKLGLLLAAACRTGPSER